MTTCSIFIIREVPTSCKGKCCFFNILRNRQFFDDFPHIISENRGHALHAPCFIAVFGFPLLPIVAVKAGGSALPLPQGGAEVLPAVALVETVVIRQEVEGVDAPGVEVPTDEGQELPGDALAAVLRLHENGADIGTEVRALMEVVLDDAAASYDGLPLPGEIPLRYGGGGLQGRLHALLIGGERDAPFPVKPSGSPGQKLRVLRDA